MDTKAQRLFAWTGPAMIVVFLIGFEVAHFVPPPSPTANADVIVTFFAQHATGVRLGLLIASFGAALLVPWSVVLSLQLRRISPGHRGYAYTELIFGTLLVVEFLVPMSMWEGIAFRPEVGQAITLRLNDMASVMLVGVVSTAVVEAVILGYAMLRDERPTPLFPRWVAYSNYFAAASFSVGGLCEFFKTGPFAWNGFMSWWFALTVFSLWILVLTVAMLRAIAAQDQMEAPESAVPEVVRA